MEKLALRTQYPWITTYPLFANPLSILLTKKYTYNYIYASFIQIISTKKNGAISFYDFNYRTCPFLNIHKISKKIINEQSNYSEAIRYFLSKGYYLYFLINPQYINVYHGKKERCHDIFVFGFDNERQLFYIADNFTGKYEQALCTYEELRNAIEYLPLETEGYLGFNGCIELLSVNEDMKYTSPFIERNILRIRDSLINYVTGNDAWRESSPEMRVEPYGHNKFLYGIDAYKFLIDNLMEKGISNIHFPSCFLMFEHKEHFQRIIFYLEEIGHLANGKLYKERVDELVKMSKINVNLVIKDRIAYSRKTERKIMNNYKKMEYIERILIKNIINDIQI